MTLTARFKQKVKQLALKKNNGLFIFFWDLQRVLKNVKEKKKTPCVKIIIITFTADKTER